MVYLSRLNFINTTAGWISLMSSSRPVKIPVSVCATTLQSVEVTCDIIIFNKAKTMIAGGFDDISEEGSSEFANMKATSNVETEFAMGCECTEMSRPATTTHTGFSGSHPIASRLCTHHISLSFHLDLSFFWAVILLDPRFQMAPPIQQPRLQHSLSSFNNRPIDGAMITPDTRSSSQSSPDIDMSKQFAAVLQNVFRSIDVNPDDVDYGICRRGFQYISGANHVKQMEVFTGVGLNEFEVISAIAKDRSFAFLKPRLTYDTCGKVLIVKMPSALHEAPLDELKTVLERKLDYLPSHPG
ncbi:hypothetical protein PISMIDRAFT_11729 [Pisolithus microcarpus 441]|uniref:Beta-ketoacyl synthase-like N-terminal domain-containing protein n=1 Tax=Pisolithus microcarpus 441 TaxID=765257 RepID=A0A0C9ZR91_9AGAM|nr:hypothetical protein PISMIDRAFT_11729 [Pisolithus microcarpus 441]